MSKQINNIQSVARKQRGSSDYVEPIYVNQESVKKSYRKYKRAAAFHCFVVSMLITVILGMLSLSLYFVYKSTHKKFIPVDTQHYSSTTSTTRQMLYSIVDLN